MSRFIRNAALAVLTFAAAGALASVAAAQSAPTRLVVFGDSLSDNGNLFAATAGTNPPSPPYVQGRFSNGPVYTELLGFNAARIAAGGSVNGSINLAFGGARTDSSASPPGMRAQLATYTSLGGTFRSTDLVSILGGANNLFQGFTPAVLSGTPQSYMQAVAVSAATDVNFIVNSVAAGGAGTILVGNLPRLGATPQFRGTAAAPLADFATTTFNTALAGGLANIAAARPGSNIILMDVYTGLEAIMASPGAFGLTNVTNSCFNQTTLSVCATPGTYLFWDGVHPTAAGHQLLATLANDYLNYSNLGAQATVMGEHAFKNREDALELSSEIVSGRDTWEPGATRMTFGALVSSTDYDARGPAAAAESSGWGGRVGIDHVFSPNWRGGVAWSFGSSDVEAGPLTFQAENYGADAWLGWRSGNVFANASVGASIDQYDEIERVASLAPLVQSGSTDGRSWGARLQGGMWFDMGGIALSPRAAVTWGLSKVNEWNESGFAANLQYLDREVEVTTGEVVLRAEGGREGLRFYAEGGYRDTISDNSEGVGVSIAGNSSRPIWTHVEDPFGGSALAAVGVEADLWGGTVELGYRGRFGDAAESHMGGVTLRLPL